MAARRLIIVMLVLLGISTAVAFITPVPEDEPSSQESAPPTGATGATGNPGVAGTAGETAPDEAEPLDSGTVEASVSPDELPKTVKASPGDRLVLDVDTGKPMDLEIPGLGLTGTTTEYAPAVFDVRLPGDPGTYEVVEVGGEMVAVIETAAD